MNNKAGAIWMAAKFSGKCAAGCIFPIAKGEKIAYIPSERKAYHVNCAPKAAHTDKDVCDYCGNGHYTHTNSCRRPK